MEKHVRENIQVTKPGGLIWLLAVPDYKKIFAYYHSFKARCFYALSLLFKGGLFSDQIGYWHKRERFIKIALQNNLKIELKTDAAYRMDIALRK